MTNKTRRPLPPSSGETPKVRRIQMQEFARRLYQAMLAKGWTQSDLARAAFGTTKDSRGYSVPARKDRISAYINGRGMPSQKLLAKIAKALDTTPEKLAPELHARSIEQDAPEISINASAGHADQVLLQVNKIVPARVASEVFAMLAHIDPDVLK